MKRWLKNYITIVRVLFLFSIFAGCFLMAACSSSPVSTAVPLPTQPLVETFEPPLASAPPADPPSLPTETSVPASSPSGIFIDSSVPEGLWRSDLFPTLLHASLESADFWLGPAESAPAGECLVTFTWVYALAAPFPTLIDEVTQETFAAFWQGMPQGGMQDVSVVYVPTSLEMHFSALWGAPDLSHVVFYETRPTADTLWEAETAWLILPFDQLEPRLKVIRVAGQSPLLADFDPKGDLLSVRYALVALAGRVGDVDPALTLLEGLPTTNRDPDKMTSLVMTGVTALVRATAYRMETNGLLYPAEDIVDWLASADLTHISNEVSFYEDCPFPDPNSGRLFFCSNPAYIALFEYVGADIIELTGNHNNDSWFVYGVDVVPFSLDLYRQRDMVYYGGGENLADAMSPALVSHHGNQLAFIGCNASGPDYAWATPARGGSAPCDDYAWLAAEVSRLKAEGYLPIVTFQYYENYSNIPSEIQIRDFGKMAEAGAVIVNGSQAHRPKGMAFEAGAFIDYGLGNLFFDQMGVTIDGNLIEQTRWEIIQRHTFYDGRYLSTELLTAMLEDYARPRPMTEAERLQFLTEIFGASGWDFGVK